MAIYRGVKFRLNFVLVKFHSHDGSGCQFLHSAAVSMALFFNSTGIIANKNKLDQNLLMPLLKTGIVS